MSYLSKQQILAAEDLPFRDIEVVEWGGTVRVAGLNAKEAADFSAKLVRVDSKGKVQELKMDNFLAELLARTLVDEQFNRVFSEADIEALGKKSAAVLKRLSDVAMQLSGLSEAEETAKN